MFLGKKVKTLATQHKLHTSGKPDPLARSPNRSAVDTSRTDSDAHENMGARHRYEQR